MSVKNIDLTIKNNVTSDLTEDFIKRIVSTTILFAKKRYMVQVSVVFVGSAAMQRLEQRYGQSKRTHTANVLAFTLSETPRIGDIVVCARQARKEAKRYGHTSKEHLVFLIIHGMLHILGFSHEHSLVQRQKMERLEDQILQSLPELKSKS